MTFQGGQGVGKSTIMSLLTGKHTTFPVQSKEHLLFSQHCTTGVDISVTPERIILLDTQALFSPSALAELYKTEPPLPSECSSYEHMHELQSLQLAIFLLSVCHMVIAVQDGNIIDWKCGTF